MKAILYTHYGSPDVLQLQEMEKPVPKDGELLVKVYASSVNAYDRHLMRSKPLLIRIMSGNGLLKPKDQRLGVLAEGSLMLWLLVMGLNVQRWKEQASAAGASIRT